MTQSTVYPEKILILGNKVYVRNMNNITEEKDENDNIIYNYEEKLYTKDEYIKMLKDENDNLKVAMDSTNEAMDFLLMNGGM